MRFFLLISILFISYSLSAQDIGDDLMNNDTIGEVLLRKEIQGGIVLHTQGWGIEFRKGRSNNVFKKRLLELDLVRMRSPKEIKTINPYFNNSKSYSYGKLNSVWIVRAGYSFHKQLNRKPYHGGVEVRYFYGMGGSLAFAKPIYLNIIRFTSSFYEFSISTEKYDPDIHFVDNIYGRASFLKGFDEISFHPGAYARFGFNFDYSPEYEKIRMLEVGAIVDVYPILPVEIMAFNDKEYFFINFYLSYKFGRKYNRQLEKEDLGL